MPTIGQIKNLVRSPPKPEAKPAAFVLPPPVYAMVAPAIGKQVATVKGELAKLEAAHSEASLAAVIAPDPAAAEKLREIRSQLDAAKDRLRTLTTAYDVALVKDKLTERQCAAEIARAQLRGIAVHLAARDKAAVALREALEAAAAAWQVLVKRSDKARAEKPVTFKADWPGGSLCDFGSLHRLVAAELFRVAGDPTIGSPRSFPGAHPQRLDQLNQPAVIEPLDEAIKRASAHTLAVLRGQIAD